MKRNQLGVKEELDVKLGKVDQIDQQLEVAEIGITRRRSRMISLQERSDAKEEKLRRIKLQFMKIDENNKRNSFIEDLEQFEADDTLTKIEERSQLGFTDILKLSKNAPKAPSLPKQKSTKALLQKAGEKNMGHYKTEFIMLKEDFLEHYSQRQKIENDLRMNKDRISRVSDKFLKESQRIYSIQDTLTSI